MDVFFETQRGKQFSIEIGYWDTILEIKEKIQKYQSIPVPKQTLIFHGRVLQDDGDVGNCTILNESHIQLIVSTDNSTSTNTNTSNNDDSVPDDNNNNSTTTTATTVSPQVIEQSPPSKKTINLSVNIPSVAKVGVPIEMELNDTVLRLKEKIREMESVPVNRIIVQYNGQELTDNRYLCECQLREGAEIDAILRPSPTSSSNGSGGPTGNNWRKLKVVVLTKCGTKRIPVEMNPSDNVGELKKELAKLHKLMQFTLPEEGYFFIYKQNVMDDDRSFRWHNVCQGDVIEIFNGTVSGG